MTAFLDTGLVGAVSNPAPKSQTVQQIKAWTRQMEAKNHRLIVPAIVDYEQRREHTRRDATESLAELDRFVNAIPGRYLALTDSALKRAALLWAEVRQRGLPTADAKSLDCDIILAAQVLDLDLPIGSYVVVTDNVAHLSRVIACELGDEHRPLTRRSAPPAR